MRDETKKEKHKNHIEQKSNVPHLYCGSPAILLHASRNNKLLLDARILYVIILHSQYPQKDQNDEKILLASCFLWIQL